MSTSRRYLLSLSTKLMLSVVVVISVAALFVAGHVGDAARRRLIEAKAGATSTLSDFLAESLTPALDFGDADAVGAELRHLKTNPDVTYAAVWMGNSELPLVEVGRRSRGRGRPSPQSKLDVGQDRISVVRILKNPHGDPIGVMLNEFTLEREAVRIEEARQQIFRYSLGLALGVSMVVFGVMRMQVTRPLHRLVAAVEELGTGTRASVQLDSHDEIGVLGRAFNTMADAIADRESRLADANLELKQLLDNMRQAIVVFGPVGTIAGFRSRQADTFFDAHQLHSGNVLALLYPNAVDSVECQAFSEWLTAAFELPFDAWQEIIELAPGQVVLDRDSPTERVLSLDFIPLVRAGKLQQVMLLASDVSNQVRLEQIVKKQDQDHSRQLAAMRRLLAGGGQLLVAMLDGARARISDVHEQLAASSLDLTGINRMFRQIHTIKGEARAFDLGQLEDAASSLEDHLSVLRSRFRDGATTVHEEDLALLRTRLGILEEAVTVSDALLVKASPIGAAILQQVTVLRPDLDRVLELSRDAQGELGLATRRLAARPFGESLLYLAEAVPNWGQRFGKEIELEVEGRDTRVPLELARVLPAVMTHLARNAVAHGIETPSERAARNKPSSGHLLIYARELGSGLEIGVSDDGRGLDRDKIAEQAIQLGLVGAPEQVIFAAGLSTSIQTALSGRGVGLYAVREDLASVGYTIELMPSREGISFRIALKRGASIPFLCSA